MKHGHVTDDMKYVAQVNIPSYFVDASQRLRPSSFMDMAQEMAYHAADTMHFGYHDLLKANIVWVLTRMHIRFVQRPKWAQTVDFATWHKEPMGVFFLRDFHLTDTDGATLIDASTCWTVIDIESRKMFRGDAINEIVAPQWTCRDSIYSGAVPKVAVPKHVSMEQRASHTVAYSDVDLVGHTNNTRYLIWAMDCLDYNYLASHEIKEVTINFNHETRASEVVSLLYGHDADTHYVIGLVDGKQVFAIEMIFV